MPLFSDQMLVLCEQLDSFLHNYEVASDQQGKVCNQELNNLKQEYDKKIAQVNNFRSDLDNFSQQYSKIAEIPVVHLPPNSQSRLSEQFDTYYNRVQNGIDRIKLLPKITIPKFNEGIELSIQYAIALLVYNIGFNFVSIWYNTANNNPLFDTKYIKSTPLGFLDTSIFIFILFVVYQLNKQKVQNNIIASAVALGIIIHLIIGFSNDWFIRFLLQMTSLVVIIWLGLTYQKRRNDDLIQSDMSKFVVDYANAQQKLIEQQKVIDSWYQKQYQTISGNSKTKGNTLNNIYSDNYKKIVTEINRFNASTKFSGLEWSNSDWRRWIPASTIPVGISTGKLVHGQYRNHPDKQLPINAILPFATGKNVLFVSEDDSGRQKIHLAMQSIALRFFATLPPGMGYFYFIDPKDLGSNLQGFSTLSNDKKYLIHDGAITQSDKIHNCLDDLLEHIRRIQGEKLQNKYQTIEDYNLKNPRLKEPYRFCVIFDFPDSFQNLYGKNTLGIIETIAQKGPKCGIYLTTHVDDETYNKQFNTITSSFIRISQKNNFFKWDDIRQVFSYDLILDSPPEGKGFNYIVRTVSENIQQSDDINFDDLYPSQTKIWTESSASGVSIPLGIKGDGEKLIFSLDKDTTNIGALLGGMAGSGKSNLLHVMIMSFARLYSPDELILYLVDLKTGVEFNHYANLPHVRVLGLESDPEYGLAILDNLIEEKESRLKLFRDTTGDLRINEYKQKRPKSPMPRIIVIFDEYQKLLEDDATRNKVLPKIEDLARQGRAAGIHLILATQTVTSGMLTPGILDQMSVRIALRSTEDNSNRIIGNDSAKQLQNCGDAIFTDNPAIGPQYNQQFRVAKSPNDDEYRRLVDLMNQSLRACGQKVTPARIYKGNEPARIADYQHFFSNPPFEPGVFNFWLGEPVGLQNLVEASIQQDLNNNISIITPTVTNAYGMMFAGILSIIQQLKRPYKLFIFDSEFDREKSAIFRQYILKFKHNKKIELVDSTQQEIIINLLHSDIIQKDHSNRDVIPTFLFILGIQRFPRFRYSESSRNFLQDSPELSINSKFLEILQKGPEKGTFTIICCDNYSNLKLYFPDPHRNIRELFAVKVAGIMDGNDLSNYINSIPTGAKPINREHRAIYYSMKNTEFLRIRPFGIEHVEE